MKILLVVLGCISCVLGIVGIFVPLLPTTPFLLLSAAFWVRSSPRLYGWLLEHPCFGEYVRNFRENRAIPLRAKIISLTLMWGTMLYCIFALLTAWWWAQAAIVFWFCIVFRFYSTNIRKNNRRRASGSRICAIFAP